MKILDSLPYLSLVLMMSLIDGAMAAPKLEQESLEDSKRLLLDQIAAQDGGGGGRKVPVRIICEDNPAQPTLVDEVGRASISNQISVEVSIRPSETSSLSCARNDAKVRELCEDSLNAKMREQLGAAQSQAVSNCNARMGAGYSCADPTPVCPPGSDPKQICKTKILVRNTPTNAEACRGETACAASETENLKSILNTHSLNEVIERTSEFCRYRCYKAVNVPIIARGKNCYKCQRGCTSN